jgi:hypothetical protein
MISRTCKLLRCRRVSPESFPACTTGIFTHTIHDALDCASQVQKMRIVIDELSELNHNTHARSRVRVRHHRPEEPLSRCLTRPARRCCPLVLCLLSPVNGLLSRSNVHVFFFSVLSWRLSAICCACRRTFHSSLPPSPTSPLSSSQFLTPPLCLILTLLLHRPTSNQFSIMH